MDNDKIFQVYVEATRREILKGLAGTAASVIAPTPTKKYAINMSKMFDNAWAIQSIKQLFETKASNKVLAFQDRKPRAGESHHEWILRINKEYDALKNQIPIEAKQMQTEFFEQLKHGTIKHPDVLVELFQRSDEVAKALAKIFKDRSKRAWAHISEENKTPEAIKAFDYFLNHEIDDHLIDIIYDYAKLYQFVPAIDIVDDAGRVLINASKLVEMKAATPLESVIKRVDKVIERNFK
jgi:hypothetical protein